MTETLTMVQTQRIYIKAAPELVWAAITSPEWSQRYGYSVAVDYDLVPGGTFAAHANEGMRAMGTPDVVIDGQVIEADPPRRLVQTWHVLMDPTMAAEESSRVTWELDDRPGGMTRLTVTHEFPESSVVAALMAGAMEDAGAGGGWAWVLSGMKTAIETGQRLEAIREV
jgi:uncharacterized protein YndB with AHSA1/START domain